MNEHQLRDLQLQLQLLHQSRRAAVTFARNLRLEQEKATFSDPADKRAVEFILDSQHDLEDFFDQIRHFVDEEGKVVRLRDSERDRLEGFISWCARYCTSATSSREFWGRVDIVDIVDIRVDIRISKHPDV